MMQLGVWIPNCRHLATPEIIRRTAVRAEQLGYDSVWVSDHVVVPNAQRGAFRRRIYDPLITLAVAAGATSRVRLGTTVLIVPYRNPVVTAKMVSSLDALSGGRFVLGVGAGWLAEESAMLGVPFEERGPMTDEYLAAMRELWTSPAPSFAGKYTQFSGLHFEPKPVQKPHPPIWVGGHARASLRRAAEIGAAWHPINRSVEELRAGTAELQRLCEMRGRAVPPAVTLRNDAFVLRSRPARPGPCPRRERAGGGAGRPGGPDRRAGRCGRRAPGARVPGPRRRRPRRADGALRRARAAEARIVDATVVSSHRLMGQNQPKEPLIKRHPLGRGDPL